MIFLPKFFRFILIISTVGILSACAVAPRVEYTRITSAAQLKGDEFDSFALQKSVIKIDAKKDGKGVVVSPLEVTVTSAPTEYNDFKIAIRHADKLGVRTNLNITKIENTDLIKEIGTEVIDSRVEMINKVGGILVKLAPVAFNATEGITASALPMSINMQVIMQNNKVVETAASDISISDGVAIDFGPVPKDAREIIKFPDGQPVSALFYAACRTATVKVALKDNQYEQTVKISDPRYFQSVSLPLKGKVTMHSECGASVSSDKDSGVKPTVDVVEALVAQGKAIKDALDSAGKSEK